MAIYLAPPCQLSAARSKQSTQPQSSNPHNPGLDPEDLTKDIDADKLEHDIGVTQGVATEALAIMLCAGVKVSAEELANAQQIIPKVAGTAQRWRGPRGLGR
ncbi:hypothetical protein FRC07_013271 [Ceratobasidium sp. 392]|nr:hypothetical protein FRC07_013271 [Ceratobasidium sp. 392]